MPSKANLVRRLNFCEWTEAQSRWISRDAWLACGGRVEPEEAAHAGGFCDGVAELLQLVEERPKRRAGRASHHAARQLCPAQAQPLRQI